MFRRFLLAVGALLLLGSSPARADQAVVVGVDRYPALRPEAGLAGCANDARLMAERLRGFGFEVNLLIDEAATRQGILQALQQVPAGERFVFYFSGHGTGGPTPYLLPHDSVEGSLETDLAASDLHAAVAAVPASTRTVILDACFSRLYARARGLGTAGRSRHYEKVRSRGLGPQDGPVQHLAPAAPRPEVCYFVASRVEEPAQEEEIGGHVHGVFTHYLASRLLSNRIMWADLQMEVAALVAERTGDTQHPTLSPEFAGEVVFGGPGTGPMAAQSAGPRDAWELFNRDRIDRRTLDLAMRPPSTSMRVGDLLSFSANVGADGYLVVVERGVSGKVNLLFPEAPQADRARVRAGEAVGLPGTGRAYTPDRPGNERVRALLFGSHDEAQRFLDLFRSAPDSDFRQFVGSARDLRLVTSEGARSFGSGMFTSDVFFEVLPVEASSH